MYSRRMNSCDACEMCCTKCGKERVTPNSVEITRSNFSTMMEAHTINVYGLYFEPISKSFDKIEDISNFFIDKCESEMEKDIRAYANTYSQNLSFTLKCCIEFMNQNHKVWEQVFESPTSTFISKLFLQSGMISEAFANLIAEILTYQLDNREVQPQIFRLKSLSLHCKIIHVYNPDQ